MNIDTLQQLFKTYLDAYANIAADERETSGGKALSILRSKVIDAG
jgi:hypothetical protein